jgi:hypothetical protein
VVQRAPQPTEIRSAQGTLANTGAGDQSLDEGVPTTTLWDTDSLNRAPPLTWEEFNELCAYIQAWQTETNHPILDVDEDRMAEHDRDLPVTRRWARDNAPNINEKALIRFLQRRNVVCDCMVWSINTDDLAGYAEWRDEAEAIVRERQKRYAADRKHREARGG